MQKGTNASAWTSQALTLSVLISRLTRRLRLRPEIHLNCQRVDIEHPNPIGDSTSAGKLRLTRYKVYCDCSTVYSTAAGIHVHGVD